MFNSTGFLEGQNIYLIRHGETEANQLGLACGRMDIPLTTFGEKQARELGPLLQKFLPESKQIFCSPLLRAQQTLKIAFGNHQFQTHEDLTEIETGDFSKLNFQQIYEMDIRYQRLGLNKDLQFPNGESLEMASQRINRFVDKNIKNNNTENIFLVTHSGSINLVLHNLLQSDLRQYPAFLIDHCALTCVTMLEGIWRLKMFNFSGAHL